MATGHAPVLEALTDINAVSVARTELDPATLVMVRLAALVAVDAPAASYLLHVEPAIASGVTVETVQDVLVAVAPITGTPRVLSAAKKITEALGLVIAVAEAATDAEAAADTEAAQTEVAANAETAADAHA
jgi:alkylhydroperoxidase/carboxymuconolactone decarboxylase family protein YurZ